METTALLLAGGLGTRLRSVVSDRPKVLAEVAGRPFLAYILDQVQSAGIRHAVISTGYLAEQFAEVLGNHHGEVALEYVHEESPLGTGGAIKWAGGRVRTEHCVVMNGDSYVDADLGEYLAWHQAQANDASLLLVKVADASRYGTVALRDDGTVKDFLEKQPGGGPGLINAGVYALRTELFSQIPEGKCSLESAVLPEWLIRHRVAGRPVDAPFIDIGIPEDYQRSHEFMSGLERKGSHSA